MTNAALAQHSVGLCDQAVEGFRNAIDANRSHPLSHFGSAAAYVQVGRQVEAISAVRTGLTLDPGFSVSRARAAWTIVSDNSTYLAALKLFLEDLGTAGVPE